MKTTGYLYKITFGVLLLLIFISAQIELKAQSCLTGKIVISDALTPIRDANVKINSQTGTITNAEGIFRICNLPSDSVEISVSYIGYRTVNTKYFLKPGDNQMPEIKLVQLALPIEEFVVTATRTDNLVTNTPVRVNMISPKMMANIPLQNIDEAIRFAPGINFSRPFGIYSTKSIVTMRGMSGKEQGRVLVLLDGIPLNKSDGGSVDWNLVDMNTVKKIEITKGPGSAIYGGNAMGGVINMISKLPEKNFYLNASLEYGTYSTFGGRLSSGGQIRIKNPADSWNWAANIFHKQSDGYVTQSEADVQANPYIVKSNMMETGMGLKTSYHFGGKHSLELSGNVYNDRRGTGEKVYQPEGNTTDHDSYGIRLNYKGNFGSYQGGLKINSVVFTQVEYYKKVNEYMKDDYTWYNVLSTRADYGWLNTFSQSLGKNHLVTGGFDLKTGSVDAYDEYLTSTDVVYNKGKMNTYAFYAQDEIRLFNEQVRIIAGIRYDLATFYDGAFYIENPTMETDFMDEYQVPDMETQNWSAFSPRLSAQYRWKGNNRVFAGYSRGFRPSVLDDLCRSGRIKGGFKLANPAIKPEFLDNIETGLDLDLIKNLFWSTSVYYSKGKDFQYYVTNGQTIDMGFGNRPIFVRANISSVEIYGLETELRYSPSAELNVFANYAFTHSMIEDYEKIAENDTIDLSGNYLTDVPKHIFSAGINYENRIVNAGVYVHYNGEMYINDQNTWDELVQSDQYPAYTTVDLKFSKVFKTKYQLSLNIQNLFDVEYYDSKYAVCPGRFITGEISYRL